MKTYTLVELKEAFAVFEKEKVLRVLVQGKWETLPLDSIRGNIEGTQAQLKDLSDVMDFCEFLEKKWQKKTK